MANETVYGVHTVREVLRRGGRRAREVLLARSRKDPAAKEIAGLARRAGVPVSEVTKEELGRRLPGANHQGVALVAEELPVLSLPEALATIEVSERSVWLGLDGVTDPTNLGGILRNAACFGVAAVLVTERRSAKPTPLVQRIASGAAEHVRVISAVNLNQSILRLRKEGFWVYGAALEGEPLPAVPLHGPALVIIGAEGKGIRRKTREHADQLVRIPQAPGGVASLNAASATAVVLYEVSRRLGGVE